MEILTTLHLKTHEKPMTSLYRGILKHHEPLAPYTSWRIGGPADIYFRPADRQDLILYLNNLSADIPLTWLGLGSNTLIHDKGIRGCVIHLLYPTSPPIEMIPDHDDNHSKVEVRVEAGMPCAKLAKFCAKHGLVGAEFFAGIPGTIGGALAMNAGAWGGETWPLVTRVAVTDRFGKIAKRQSSEYTIGYRTAIPPVADEWFISADFAFLRGNTTETNAKIKELLQKRNLQQPIGVYSCGSVFKNPPNDHAGRLIESADLKGFQIGDAKISDKHANFILNVGKASATDVQRLIHYIQDKVQKLHNIKLQTEVRFLGFS